MKDLKMHQSRKKKSVESMFSRYTSLRDLREALTGGKIFSPIQAQLSSPSINQALTPNVTLEISF